MRMARTAVSMLPCPVIMAISVRGANFFTCSRNSSPDILGIIRSARIRSGESDSIMAMAASALSASAQTKFREAPMVAQRRRTLLSSSTIRNLRPGSFMRLILQDFLKHGKQLVHTKGFFYAGHAGASKHRGNVIAGCIAGHEDHPREQLRAMTAEPGMQIRALHLARHSHVAKYAAKITVLQQFQGFDSRGGDANLISVLPQR